MPTVKKAAPAKQPGRVLNLNAARAARAEAAGEPAMLEVGTETFTLPPELPYDVVRLSQKGDIDGALSALFVGDAWAEERFYAQNLSYQDIEALVEGLLDLYGVGEGK